MGMFDSALFQPSNYNGMWGALLDELRNGSFQLGPSQGFPAAPTQAMAQAAPQEAYQSAPQQQPQYQQQPQLAPQPPASPGLFERLSAASHNLAAGPGLVPGLFDAAQGLSTGQRLDPTGMGLQVLQTRLQGLMQQPGMTPDKALAIVSNPELAKAYYAPQTYDFETLPDGSIVRRNARMGTIEPAYKGAAKPIPVKPGEMLVSPSGPGASPDASGAYSSVFSNNTGIFDKPTLTTMADQYLAGDKSVLQNLSRSEIGALNTAALRQRITERMGERGILPEDQAAKMAEFGGYEAAQTTLGKRSANIDMAVTEATQLAPQVLQTSSQVNRTQFPALNKIILAAQEGTGDPNVVKFGAALNSFINVYSRAINPFGTTTVNDKEHARELLSTAWANGQISAGVEQLTKEMELAKRSPELVRSQIRKSFTDATRGAGAAPQGAISALKANPQLASQYDAKYGAGAAAKIIGGQ